MAYINIPVPGVAPGQQVGLGDLVKRGIAAATGIRPCGGCEQRRQFLNRLLQFQGPPAPPAPPRRTR